MKIHYFYNHEQGGFGFYKLELRAYLEEKEYSRLGELRLNFRCLEHLNIHISKIKKPFNQMISHIVTVQKTVYAISVILFEN